MENIKFPFRESPDTACITCSHIIENGSPILYAAHDDDGWWQFLCGAEKHKQEHARLVSLNTILGLDSSISEIADMECEHSAIRSSLNDDWNRE